jgi:thioredoxin reductase (NADPH)
MPRHDPVLDCLVVGGGPAGLTAALYLARFRRNVIVIDEGRSRAAQIPESHNHPGFTGISGKVLLERLRRQARSHGVRIRRGRAQRLVRKGGTFTARIAGRTVRASCVLLATGITDTEPPLRGTRSAVALTAVRYCPVCDGFEATDKAVAVYGPLEQAADKALFLRSYTRRVTIISCGGSRRRKAMDELKRSRIRIVSAARANLLSSGDGIRVSLEGGEVLKFDVLYPALGCAVHSDLGRALGAKVTRLGFLKVNSHQETSVKGLYAAGDVVSDLHQLCVGEAHAAIAATAIHNRLPRNVR